MAVINHQNDNATQAGLINGRRKERVIEVLVFLFLIMPSMVLSFFALKPSTLAFGFSCLC
jgi:hypothetical protein